MRALIIEDNGLLSWRLEELLTDLRYDIIETAKSDLEAVRLASLNCPDLILADCHLVDGSGVEAVREICAGQAIATVLATGDAQGVRPLVDNAVIAPKPVSDHEIVGAIEQAKSRPLSFPELRSGTMCVRYGWKADVAVEQV